MAEEHMTAAEIEEFNESHTPVIAPDEDFGLDPIENEEDFGIDEDFGVNPDAGAACTGPECLAGDLAGGL